MAQAEVAADRPIGIDPDLLYERDEAGYSLTLRLENRQMECRLEYQRLESPLEESAPLSAADEGQAGEESSESLENSPHNAAILTPAELILILSSCRIRETIDYVSLYDFCAAVAEGADTYTVVIARGYAPVAGADGWFEMLVKTSGDDAEFTEDEHGYVDLRTRNAFTEIEPGQKIGMVHPPKEGRPGLTAHGVSIPAERGREYSLVAGDGVILKYGNRIAFAEKAGRAFMENQVLSVVDHLVVSGDLDLKVGNIDFHGFVEVKGDVLDEFHIKASRGIRVTGVVGACRLESGGPVEVGSVAGKESGRILCRGELKAGFLNQVTVECHGHVLVKNEIRNAQIKATGRIVVERGSIVGGSCVALEGIEAKSLGASSGTATQLTAGVYFPDADRFAFLHQSIAQVEMQISRIKAAIGPLEKVKNFNAAMEKRLGILTQQWEKLELQLDGLNSELAASRKQEHSATNPKINVGTILREGVFINLGETAEKIVFERKGPLSIIENTRCGGLRFLQMTPLRELAADLEDGLLEREIAEAQALEGLVDKAT